MRTPTEQFVFRNKIDNYKIVKNVLSNKLNTTNVADALGKTGSIPGFKYRGKTNRIVAGTIKTYTCIAATNYGLHKYIQDEVLEGHILVVDATVCMQKSILGDLVSDYLFNEKKVAGLVVRGSIRDADQIMEKDYPVWSNSTNPVGVINQDLEKQLVVQPNPIEDGIMVCDATGLVLIKDKINKKIIHDNLSFMAVQEQIWDYCISTLGWSTFETICDKNYLKARYQDENLSNLTNRLSRYDFTKLTE